MKKQLLIPLCIAAVMLSACKNSNSKDAKNNSDSSVIDSTDLIEIQDTTPKPMFIYIIDKDYMQMVYWTDNEEPKLTNDNADYYMEYRKSWMLQDGFRRNAAQYTKLFIDDKGNTIDIKYLGESLKDPDGNKMYGGELHSIKAIPSPGLKYALVNNKDSKKIASSWGLNLAVTDSYLASRTLIPLKYYSSANKRLPSNVIKQMEKEYGMKAQRSQLICSSDKYSYGVMQFKGAYRTVEEYGEKRQVALALEVFIVGDTAYSYPVEGYYDKSYGPTWNVDDGGEYLASNIVAFEGPKGPEFCFIHYAPESATCGMFYINDGVVSRTVYEIYHTMIDEEEPVWKKDIAKMQQLCRKADPQNYKNVSFSKIRTIYIDGDNHPEVWLRDKNETHGAFFTKNGDNIQLIALELNPETQPVLRTEDYNTGFLELTGKGEGGATYKDIYELKDSRIVHHLRYSLSGDSLFKLFLHDDKEISPEQGQQYLNKLPQAKEIYIYWNDISE